MQIVCPKCQTSYGVAVGALGPNGRNVRCAKCREVWLAMPEEVVVAHGTAVAEPRNDEAGYPDHDPSPGDHVAEHDAPMVESPSIAHDGSSDGTWSAQVRPMETDDEAPEQDESLARPRLKSRARSSLAMPAAIAAMIALILGLAGWRTEVVRLMPQTAGFFKLIGMNVNLRSLKLENVAVSSETDGGEPFIVVTGTIVPQGWNSVEVPPLRFVLNDEHGTAIYAWNMQAEQPMLHPGEVTTFKSRLASPPRNARELIVRFSNKRELATGGA